MSLLHIAYDRDTQIFIVGFFGAMISLWPVCLLFLLPYDVFLAKNVLTAKHNARLAQLEKDNAKLRLEMLDQIAIIDALLKEQMKAL